MADIELVIKIPEEIYENINNHSGMAYAIEDYLHEVEWAIKNGTPLPKGHGDLKDVNDILGELTDIDGGINMDIFTNEVREIINDSPTIIKTERDSQFEEMLKLTIEEVLRSEEW